jgi:hypothetical protein
MKVFGRHGTVDMSSSNPVSERVLRPADVTVGFCIPTTVTGYREHLARPESHEFAGMVSRSELIYKKAIINLCIDARKKMSATGAQIADDVTVSRFSELIRDEHCHCFILFAHVKEGRLIEFFDGLREFDALINAVPFCYSGILDLCLCNARNLAIELRRARPAIGPIKVVDSLVDFAFNVRLYTGLVKLLSEGSFTYLEAFSAAVQALKQSPPETCWRRLFRKT